MIDKRVLVPVMILTLLVALSLTGCVGNTKVPNSSAGQPQNASNTQEQNQVKHYPKLMGIDDLSVTLSGSVYTIEFDIADENGKNIGIDGTVHIILKDKLGNILYNGTVGITEGDRGIFGYEIKIPLSQVDKSPTSEKYSGILKLTIITVDNQTVTGTDESVEIPVMSEEEIFNRYNQEYLTTAKQVQASITKNKVTLSVKRFGYITLPEFGTWGDTTKFFRVDIEIRNNRNSDFSLDMSPKLIYKGKQYDDIAMFTDLPGVCNTFVEDVSPGISKECYILFKNVPDGIDGDFTLELGSEWSEYTGYNEVKYSVQVA